VVLLLENNRTSYASSAIKQISNLYGAIWGGFYGLVKAIDFFKAPLVFNFPPHAKSSASVGLLLVELGLEKALRTHTLTKHTLFLSP
jgi:hypothetical protein